MCLLCFVLFIVSFVLFFVCFLGSFFWFVCFLFFLICGFPVKWSILSHKSRPQHRVFQVASRVIHSCTGIQRNCSQRAFIVYMQHFALEHSLNSDAFGFVSLASDLQLATLPSAPAAKIVPTVQANAPAHHLNQRLEVAPQLWRWKAWRSRQNESKRENERDAQVQIELVCQKKNLQQLMQQFDSRYIGICASSSAHGACEGSAATTRMILLSAFSTRTRRVMPRRGCRRSPQFQFESSKNWHIRGIVSLTKSGRVSNLHNVSSDMFAKTIQLIYRFKSKQCSPESRVCLKLIQKSSKNGPKMVQKCQILLLSSLHLQASKLQLQPRANSVHQSQGLTAAIATWYLSWFQQPALQHF